MKKYPTLLAMLYLMGTNGAWAQSESESSVSAWQSMDSNQLIILITLGIILGIILLLLVLMVYLISFMATVFKKEDPSLVGVSCLPAGPSWWESFKERFVTGKVDEAYGSEEKAKMMANHSYDGITELDNFMPPWLQYVFIGTVIYAIGYFAYYTVLGTGLTGVKNIRKN